MYNYIKNLKKNTPIKDQLYFSLLKQNKMKIITTGSTKKFEKILLKQGIKIKPLQMKPL